MTDKIYDQREDLHAIGKMGNLHKPDVHTDNAQKFADSAAKFPARLLPREEKLGYTNPLKQTPENQEPHYVGGVLIKPMTQRQADAAMRLVEPVAHILATMTPEELGLAREGFARASPTNCWYMLGVFRSVMIPAIAFEASQRGLEPEDWLYGYGGRKGD